VSHAVSLNALWGRIIGVVGGSGHDSGGRNSNSSFFLLYKSAFSGVQSGCFRAFDALKTLEMIEPCH
jgi:hypothetical protein